jgi:hypothetical protein
LYGFISQFDVFDFVVDFIDFNITLALHGCDIDLHGIDIFFELVEGTCGVYLIFDGPISLFFEFELSVLYADGSFPHLPLFGSQHLLVEGFLDLQVECLLDFDNPTMSEDALLETFGDVLVLHPFDICLLFSTLLFSDLLQIRPQLIGLFCQQLAALLLEVFEGSLELLLGL